MTGGARSAAAYRNHAGLVMMARVPYLTARAGAPELGDVQLSRLSRLGFIDTRRTLYPVRRRVRSRGVPPALEGHEVFYPEDAQEAEALIGKALAPNRLTLGELGARGFAASMHGVRLRDVSLLYL